MRLFVLVLSLSLCHAIRAENAEKEWTVTLGCQHCQFSELTGITICKGNCGAAARVGDTVYKLQGAAVPKDFKKGGDWKIKGTLSEDGKTIVVKEMTMLPLPVTQTVEGTLKAGATSWSGTAEKTGTGLPTLVVEKTKFGLKAAKDSAKPVSSVLTKIGNGELSGKVTVSGSTYEDDTRKWIVVDEIRIEK